MFVRYNRMIDVALSRYLVCVRATWSP